MTGDAAPAPGTPAVPFAPARDGEMAARIRDLDWSRTPLGPSAAWPPGLRTMVGAMLGTRCPMLLLWGEELICLYNDAFRPILGAGMHPAALGMPGSQCWAEVWPQVGPQIETVMRDGAEVSFANQLVPFDRNGYFEEIYFTYSYSPVRGEDGSVAGTLVICTETTEQVLSERRLELLQRLAAVGDPVPAEGVAGDEVGEALAGLVDVLAGDPHDVPWALLYRFETATDTDSDGPGATARLVATAGLDRSAGDVPPASRTVRPSDGGWGDVLAAVRDTRADVVVPDLAARFDVRPGGAWPEPPTEAVAVPIPLGDDPAAYALVVALSGRKRYDEGYRQFVELVSAQFTAAASRAGRLRQERERLERLAELDRAKTAFLATVSHELRTPLTLVLAPLEGALRGAAVAGEQGAELALAHRNATRLVKLVDSLLDFTRLEAARMSFRPVGSDVARLTRECVAAFESTVLAAGLTLDLRDRAGVVADVDPDMWEKIVLNLVSNAVKYTARGTVTVEVDSDGANVVLTVRDTGIGIDPADLPHVFDRFFRSGDERARSIEGTGLGLALVREMAEMHGGAVAVRSTPDVGSTFTVTVPLGARPAGVSGGSGASTGPVPGSVAASFVAEAARWNAHALTAGHAHGTGSPDLGDGHHSDGHYSDGHYVLVVDDNADMRDHLTAALSGVAPTVAAANGREALALAAARPPDLVISDVMMPGVDGVGLAAALRAQPALADVPIILLSARADREAVIAGLEAGATDYLTKPFSTVELLHRVRTNLAVVGLRRQREEEALRAWAEQERQALDLNDSVLQSLITARLALDLDPERVAPALDRATAAVRDIIRQLLNRSPRGPEELLHPLPSARAVPTPAARP